MHWFSFFLLDWSCELLIVHQLSKQVLAKSFRGTKKTAVHGTRESAHKHILTWYGNIKRMVDSVKSDLRVYKYNTWPRAMRTRLCLQMVSSCLWREVQECPSWVSTLRWPLCQIDTNRDPVHRFHLMEPKHSWSYIISCCNLNTIQRLPCTASDLSQVWPYENSPLNTCIRFDVVIVRQGRATF